MTEQSGVFVLQNDKTVISLQPAQFATEDEFQRLLSQFPELLVGDQIDPEDPRRWILVKREQTISTNELGASQWSVDHLFLDQDGIPTLVEVKRQSDARIRREVVGQMLDYAANCKSHWSIETLQSDFDRTCDALGKSSDFELSRLIGTERSAAEFWTQVKTNLTAGRIRLLFVADKIPLELRRVVEFLNQQMDPAEVLAVELRQFASEDGLKTLVPMIYGQTQEAVRKKGAPARTWDKASFFDALAANATTSEQEVARRLVGWMEKGNRPLRFGDGKNGSVAPDLRSIGIDTRPIYLATNGKLYFQFYSWENKPAFGDLKDRQELMIRIGEAAGMIFSNADLTRAPFITLQAIAAESTRLEKILAVLSWMEAEIAAKKS